jgi:Holliday junction DNA helicase RuvA
MIGYIEGVIKFKTEKFVVVKADKVGYKIFCSSSTLEEIGGEGDEAKLYTHLYLRENLMDLYGFLSFEELEFFEALISVSGIGPKAALSVMMLAPVKTLKEAISSGQKTMLTKVAGVGAKTAERIILELSGKITAPVSDVKKLTSDSEAIDALVSLGYNKTQARKALEKLPQEVEGVENRIKEALKELGRK